MKKLFLATTAFVVLAAGSAMAADIPVKAPVYKAPPVIVYNWTGCYIGGNVGYGWQRTGNTLVVTNGAPATFNPNVLAEVGRNGTGSLNSNSFTGGAQFGCNVQSGSLVWGVETDINSFRQSASYGGRFLYSTNGNPYFINVSDDKKWLWTLRGRVGITPTDRVLLYVTGGLAVAKFNFDESFIEPTYANQLASISKTKAGWTVGAGVEAALWDNWTAKAEYLYARLDSDKDVNSFTGTAGSAGTFATFTNSIDRINLSVLRLGLNYRFGWAPVAAKY